MNAQLKSPFSGYIDSMSREPNYLSVEDAKRIISIVSAAHPSLMAQAKSAKSSKTTQEMLRDMMESLGDTITKMQMASVTGEGGSDASDLKKVADTQEKQIKLLARLAETLKADERQQELENAVIEAMDEMGDQKFKELFLGKFHKKLAEKSKKVVKFT